MKRLCIAGLVLMIGAVGVLWWALGQNPAQTFMPDGSHLYFHGATIGRHARMDFGFPMEKVMRHWPRMLGGKPRRNVWAEKSDQETLSFWFEFERMPGANALAAVQFKDVNQRRAFQAASWRPAQWLPNGRIVASCSFGDWPKWDRTLAVRVGLSDRAKPIEAPDNFVTVGELTMKNPDYE